MRLTLLLTILALSARAESLAPLTQDQVITLVKTALTVPTAPPIPEVIKAMEQGIRMYYGGRTLPVSPNNQLISACAPDLLYVSNRNELFHRGQICLDRLAQNSLNLTYRDKSKYKRSDLFYGNFTVSTSATGNNYSLPGLYTARVFLNQSDAWQLVSYNEAGQTTSSQMPMKGEYFVLANAQVVSPNLEGTNPQFVEIGWIGYDYTTNVEIFFQGAITPLGTFYCRSQNPADCGMKVNTGE